MMPASLSDSSSLKQIAIGFVIAIVFYIWGLIDGRKS